MLTTIVVPVDDGPTCERALPVAAALARATGATVELLTVDALGADPGWTAHRLGSLAAEIGPDVDVTTTVVPTTGTVVEALAQLDRAPGTLVCLAPHGRAPLAALVAGSVADGVVRRTTLPILLVGPACPAAPAMGPVVAAVDGSERDPSVVAAAVGFARATGAALEVLHVVTAPSAPDAWAAADAVLARAEAAARDSGVATTTGLVAATDPEVGVLRALDGAGCVVVGSHRRHALGRLVLGSTGTALTRRAPCPVLVAADATVAPAGAGRHPVPSRSVPRP